MNNKLLRILVLLAGLALIVSGVIKIVNGARAEEAGYERVPFETEIELNDGEGRPVAALSTRYIYSRSEGSVGVGYALTNRGRRALTQLEFAVTYLDADGGDLWGQAIEVLEGFMEEPVQPGETREFEYQHYFDRAGAAAAVSLEPIGVKDEDELPPWTEPRPNNPLPDFCNDPDFSAHFENPDGNPPVEMRIQADQSEEQIITDPDEILAVIESLRNTRIGGETDICYDDAGTGYWFTMADGSKWGVYFEGPDVLYWHGRRYEVIQ